MQTREASANCIFQRVYPIERWSVISDNSISVSPFLSYFSTLLPKSPAAIFPLTHLSQVSLLADTIEAKSPKSGKPHQLSRHNSCISSLPVPKRHRNTENACFPASDHHESDNPCKTIRSPWLISLMKMYLTIISYDKNDQEKNPVEPSRALKYDAQSRKDSMHLAALLHWGACGTGN
jgi:hypothetical protein